MSTGKRIASISFSIAVLLLLIFDPRTAAAGASEGIDLCLKVVIPSLFPFFVVTTYLNASVFGIHIPGLNVLGNLLHVPSGGESLLFLGFIGGYPVGAQLIADTYRQGGFHKRTAQIMLGYCSNAGPAFIFGVAGVLFRSIWPPLLLWLIQIFSAVITGFLLPRPEKAAVSLKQHTSMSLVQALRKSITICASVCGWILVFKIVMAYFHRFAVGQIKNEYTILITGILELSNGCLRLSEIDSESLRFVLCAVFLSFGGVCVALQTMSATEDLGMGFYIYGKAMQACISLLAALGIQKILFQANSISTPHTLWTLFICICVIILLKMRAEKVVEIL